MKTFVKHSDDCTCQQCMNLMILERIDSLENKIFAKPEKENNPVKEKSAFQEWSEKEFWSYNEATEDIPDLVGRERKKAWNSAIDTVLEQEATLKEILGTPPFVVVIEPDKIENLREQ